MSERRGEYGVDGNIVGVVAMSAGGLTLLVLAIVLAWGARLVPAVCAFAGAASLLGTIGIYLHTTRRGKFAVWAELVDGLGLSGDERVLDVGCGRGAVLTMVAKRLPRGRAVGLDLWSGADQLGNGPAAARRNLDAEGVRARCALFTGDMRSMPFADGSFDLVVSSLAIHNILDRGGRAQAIDEVARVVRPGGRVVIADLAWTGSYARGLAARGLGDVQRRHLGWRFWWGLAFPATRLVHRTQAARFFRVLTLRLARQRRGRSVGARP
ncbi:MAG TPA: class I SAM-dependent methyltransferase [Polyangia bacterium]|jgi:SAM-dependent methyltransferase